MDDDNEFAKYLEDLEQRTGAAIPQEEREDTDRLSKLLTTQAEDAMHVGMFAILADMPVSQVIGEIFISGALHYRDILGRIDPEMVVKVDKYLEEHNNS